MFDSNQFFSGGAAGFYPKEIDQSLRFNDGDSAYFSLVFGTPTNQIKWTMSMWVKRSEIGREHSLYGAANGAGEAFFVAFYPDDIEAYISTGRNHVTNAVFRDPSAWYHIVQVFDSANATPDDRFITYVNGVRQKTSTNSVTLNDTTGWNTSGVTGYLGRNFGGWFGDSRDYFDGYLAEVHFTDGTAYDADAFGEFKEGVWVAKAPSVTYGTNGFYLDFANSADIGNDVSGEGNDWTPNNFTASDVVLDSPTDNFATWNPLSNAAGTLSNGNLQLNGTSSAFTRCNATIGVSTGKWYFEAELTTASSNTTVGIGQDNLTSSYPGQDALSYAQDLESAIKLNNNVQPSYGSAFVSGDIFMCAFDLDNNKIFFGKNGTWFDSSDPVAGTSPAYTLASGTYNAIARPYSSGAVIKTNFGQQDFNYTPPSGYLALSTANLPDPAIDPAQGSSPQDYFNTVLYAGTSSAQSITGVGFQPDLVWGKNRTNVNGHRLTDVLRGVGKVLFSDTTNGDTTGDGQLSSFDSDGFSLTGGTGAFEGLNQTGNNYVAWNWKANGSGVSNTDGSITSTVSANTESGFSIVSWTDVGNSADTVGHGLNSAPEFIVWKTRGTTGNWLVNVDISGTRYGLLLESTAASSAGNLLTAPTSSVISTWNQNTTMIAYCFHSVDGFSKFGSYTGNGSNDGPFVYTGFRPAFLIAKKSDGAENWIMLDATRSEYNIVDKQLLPNLSNSEGTISRCDFLSNGFKVRAASTAFNSGTMIYMAFAENPFKYSLAR